VFSKKTGTGGGNGKPAPRPEPPKPERIINTHEDSKSITTQAEAKLCAKKWLNENKQAMGNNKWVDKNHIYQIDDAKHHGNMVEIEVFRNKGKNPPHECVLDCFGKKIKPAKKGRTYNGK
jgi:hypothetical protein